MKISRHAWLLLAAGPAADLRAPILPPQYQLVPLRQSVVHRRVPLPPLCRLKVEGKGVRSSRVKATAPVAAPWTPAFKRRRRVIFIATVVAYASFYLTRNSLYYTAPAMVASEELPAIDITSIGVITSVFPLFYGFSKFVSGVVGDVLSPRAML